LQNIIHNNTGWKPNIPIPDDLPNARIYLLERVDMRASTGESLMPKAEKTKAIFAYLCLSRAREVLRAELADMLWSRSGQEQGLDALRHALSDLSRVPAAWRLYRGRHIVSLDISNCWIDANEIINNPDFLLKDLYGISTRFDRWILEERAKYEARWNNILQNQIAGLVSAKAPPTERIVAARLLLNLRPSSGTAVCALMNAFVDMGERAEAIRAFEHYKMIVEKDGLSISDNAMSLYNSIRQQPSVRSALWPPIQRNADTLVSTIPKRVEQGTFGIDSASKPSIVVLPLQNLSGNHDHDHVIQGITEDIVETLSRMPDLFVISRLSSEVLASRGGSSQEIAAALSVRYVLSGSVRIFGRKIRLIAELSDSETGLGLWRSRIDENANGILALQSRLAHKTICTLAPHVRAAELRRTVKKHPDEYTAYDFFLRAQENMHGRSQTVFSDAEKHFDAAITRDPLYAVALAWRAYWHVMRIGQGWSFDRGTDSFLAETFAERAINADSTEAMGFAARGHVAAYLYKDFDLALEYFDRALKLNPNCARAWLWKASVHGWTCDGPSAVESITQAIALSPYDPLGFAFSASASLAYLVDQQYERAAEFAMRSIRENRSYSAAYKLLIPALVLSGRTADARHAAGQLLRLEPEFTIERFRNRSPGAGGDTGRLVAQSLAQVGVPTSLR
jgi:TolB-like protein/DNA-binding SARP family transcriptional activator